MWLFSYKIEIFYSSHVSEVPKEGNLLFKLDFKI